jgi:urease accessory protein
MAPEFPLSSNGFVADCSSSPERRAGRDGLLRLVFDRRGASTVLRHVRFTLPLQVLSPLTLEDGTCYLMLLNPTGGILGGDRLLTDITLGKNASVCLSTPSASRVYRTTSKPAVQETVIRVEQGATIEYLPDHLIPHRGSSLRQTLRVEMQSGSRGIFLDGFASGRQALGEHWNFRDLELHTEILLDGRPMFLNRTRIDPASDLPHRTGAMGNCSYCASLTIVDSQFQNWPVALAALRSELDEMPDVSGGASLLPHSGMSLRYLTKSAIALSDANSRLWTAARRHVFQLPPLDLRKY